MLIEYASSLCLATSSERKDEEVSLFVMNTISKENKKFNILYVVDVHRGTLT